jgi:hypothetical protein
MEGGIFLTTKDMMRLLGCEHYNTANRLLLQLRDSIKKRKGAKYITIKEYCEYEELDFTYIWEFLRGKLSKQ